MIHILNKGTLRNQYPVRRKTKNRRAALSSKRVLKSLADKNKEKSNELFKETTSLAGKLVKKGLMHKNKAARYQSKINKQIRSL